MKTGLNATIPFELHLIYMIEFNAANKFRGMR